MAKERFISKNFSIDSRIVIQQANTILSEYAAQGLVLTLRQLYYQFVARDLFPPDRRWRLTGANKWVRDTKGTPNAQPNYKWLGSVLSDARLAGMIDWSYMEDRTRALRKRSEWQDPESIIKAVSVQYREDLWRTQKFRPEVWIEKDALVGVIERVCDELRVPYFACRGYSSQSAQYEAGLRFRRVVKAGQLPIVLHLGDHDPSGIDMTRDNADRIAMFVGGRIAFRRLALNYDQVQQYNPPPNPAKEGDSRSPGYIAEYGESSWELDALEPTVISALIRAEVESVRDADAWREAEDEETANRADLEAVSDRWEDVRGFIRDGS